MISRVHSQRRVCVCVAAWWGECKLFLMGWERRGRSISAAASAAQRECRAVEVGAQTNNDFYYSSPWRRGVRLVAFAFANGTWKPIKYHPKWKRTLLSISFVFNVRFARCVPRTIKAHWTHLTCNIRTASSAAMFMFKQSSTSEMSFAGASRIL